ncbi:serine/threonine-protein kinase [Stieleria varia]|nr:serine/threonine-protein kinase [Stieleria varia]
MDSTIRSDLIDAPATPSLGRSTLLEAVKRGQLGPLSPGVVALVTLVLIVATLYVGWSVRQAMRSLIRDSISTVLAANVAALELWLGEQADTVERLSQDRRFEPWLNQVIASSGDVDSNDAPQLLTQEVSDLGYEGWALLNASGRVLASNQTDAIGKQFDLPRETVVKLGEGLQVISQPFEVLGAITPEPTIENKPQSPEIGSPEVIMCALSPLRQGMQLQGILALIIDPSQQFSQILSVARIGGSGETYAFDSRAVLLSRSRFEIQLRQAGLLKDNQSSPLSVHVRDPGVDIRNQALDNPNPQSWPMTLMADHATRGGTGDNVVGYNDYRGVPVIGVWRWLPKYGIGVTTELDVDEAYAPMSVFRNSFLALLALVLISSGSMLALASVLRRLDKSNDPQYGISRRLGQYELGQKIGRGGMGLVYRGQHRVLKRDVAIKVLEYTEATERSLARFQREVRLTAQLQHPNTISIYDCGQTPEGTFFYVMELIDGISLQQLVDYYGRQPAERVIYLLIQVCDSIAEAHASGMVHRDIKPANILLASRAGQHDLIKVLDFGLAKQIDHETMQLTRAESLTGTPLYMSPESVRDASLASQQSDIYSIGSVGYMLLTALAPFAGDSSADICAKKLHEDPIPPAKRLAGDFPDDLVEILMQCLHRDPEKRPQSARELARRLSRCKNSPHWRQGDAALWWREVFDGPTLDDMSALIDDQGSNDQPRDDRLRGHHVGETARRPHDTAVNELVHAVAIKHNEPTPRV